MKYSVGDLTIDTGRLQVSRGADPIPLPKLSFDLLLALVRAAPDVVSLDDLMHRVWPGLVVGPETVIQRVKLLRDALGDDPRQPRYIAGLRGRGYQIIAAVGVDAPADGVPRADESATHDSMPPQTGPPYIAAKPGSTPARKRALIALTAILGLTLLAIAVYRLWPTYPNHSLRTEVAPTAIPSATGPVDDKTIAVLPFADMSEKHDQEYFSDGLSEELINLLARIPALHVPARTSSFYFKGKSEDIPTIARRLMVAHVLEGSVRKSGNHLRITAQLVRADNGYHVWSQAYDREVDDIFKVQDEIAAAVVEALKISLLEGASLRPASVTNSASYSLYLQGRAVWERSEQPADDQRAMDFVERAVKLDPSFARAWATLASYRTMNYEYWGIGQYQQVRERAYAAAEQALKLDPNLSDAHLAMGQIHYILDWDAAAATLEFQRAIELDPGKADAYRTASDVALSEGQVDEAANLAQSAIDRDPLYAFSYQSLGNAELARGRYAEAETAFRQGVALSPAGAGLHLTLGWALLARGQPSAALAEMQQETDAGWRAAGSAIAFDTLGRKSESDQALKQVLSHEPDRLALLIAQIYANRGDLDSAFRWLDRGCDLRVDNVHTLVRGNPLFSNLRSDPRYKLLLRKMKLAE